MRKRTQVETELRGWDDDDPRDWPVGQPSPFYPRVFPRMPTERELRNRPFVGREPGMVDRCWCGRPQSDNSGTCNQGHRWPR